MPARNDAKVCSGKCRLKVWRDLKKLKISKKPKKVRGDRLRKPYHGDCEIYFTICQTCKEEVGGWSADEAEEKWDEHECGT